MEALFGEQAEANHEGDAKVKAGLLPTRSNCLRRQTMFVFETVCVFLFLFIFRLNKE